MKQLHAGTSRSLVESAVREILDLFNPFRIVFDIVFALGGLALDKIAGQSWLTIAFVTYLGAKFLIHGAIACSVRARTGKWSRPRLYFSLINLAVLFAMALIAWAFGSTDTAALYQMPLFLITAFVCDYFSDYRTNRRAARREFKRFKTELGMGG